MMESAEQMPHFTQTINMMLVSRRCAMKSGHLIGAGDDDGIW